jgi:multiple sugar transport system permease protein
MRLIPRTRLAPAVGPAVVPRARPRALAQRRAAVNLGKTFLLTAAVAALLAAFLSPMLRVMTTALKEKDQISELGAPLWPATPASIEFEGKTYDIYQVPIDGQVRDLALFKKGRQESQFLDPADPSGAPIVWQGSYRGLERSWAFAPRWENFADVWRLINYPRLLFNTIALAVIGTIGTVLSCTLVAYGFARFRIPGKGLLFTLLIATIFLPAAVTLIPTYTVFVRLGWVGTWLPLLIPTFFANAYDVFLLRQYFLTIPRELDEAAAMDGAGPFRTLLSVILPQAWPALIAITIFHFVYTWNDFFGPLIYLSTRPELQPISVGLARFNSIHYTNPAYVQAGTLMTMLIPIILFFAFQRFFIRGIVITGVEK